MKDKEKLEALLSEWGVPFEGQDTDIVVGRAYGKPGNEKVTGYSGFYTAFEFGPDGEFMRMGTWE